MAYISSLPFLIPALSAPAQLGAAGMVETHFVSPTTAPNSRFGEALALEGNRLAVGAYWDSTAAPSAGAVYIVVAVNGIWQITATVLDTDPEPGDRFGKSVGLSGDTLLVGADLDDSAGGSAAGAAFVFVRDGAGWSQQAVLYNQDPEDSEEFGFSVLLEGDTAFVGTIHDDVLGFTDAGSVTVFERSGATWTRQQRLVPSDPFDSLEMGGAMSLDGDTLAVGAAYGDRVYVFRKQGSSWVEEARFAPSVIVTAMFGRSVAISGDTIAVGADQDNAGGPVGTGSIYVYERSGTTWTETAKLLPGHPYVSFGQSVALEGDRLLGGAPNYTPAGLGEDLTGAVLRFERFAGSWVSYWVDDGHYGQRESLPTNHQ